MNNLLKKEGNYATFEYSKEDENLIDELIDKNQTAKYDDYNILVKYLVENYDKNFVLNLFQSNRQAKEFLKSELYDKVKNFCAKNDKQTNHNKGY